jgi:hypothetical protein
MTNLLLLRYTEVMERESLVTMDDVLCFFLRHSDSPDARDFLERVGSLENAVGYSYATGQRSGITLNWHVDDPAFVIVGKTVPLECSWGTILDGLERAGLVRVFWDPVGQSLEPRNAAHSRLAK